MLAINSLSLIYLLPEYSRFLRALNCPENHQKKILSNIITKNEDTEFGKKYNFRSIKSIKNFRKEVPLSDYEDYTKYIRKAMNGEQKVLTEEKINLLEPTGGSSSGSKLIPYTKGLEKEYKKGIYPWLANLYLNRPNLLNGKAYWAITPPGNIPEKDGSKIPIGFKEDTEYFGIIGRLLEKTMAVPSKLGKIDNIEEFLYLTALYLLREKNLTLISVWSPTFLLILIEKVKLFWDKILKEIEEGTDFPLILTPSPSRVKELKEAKDKNKIDFSKIWEKLNLISCWADGPSEMFITEIRENFPGVEIQGKGLLATEGIVSIPFTGFPGSVLAVRSHFYEFIDLANGEILTLGNIKRGKHYSVVMTTSGGLYRYRLNDVVEAIGKIKNTPLIKFCGKQDLISDYFGEKLNEFFVRKTVKNALNKLKIRPEFLLFAPCDNKNFNYILYIKGKIKSEKIKGLEEILENNLRKNFHYNYARNLGQLSKPKVVLINHIENPREIYMNFLINEGRKLGVIKPFIFYNKIGINDALTRGLNK
ncbi:GH3 auxin-responsive promoter family protein [candidate division WOR-3 bacterium]|nr:GH3 auxin-responsive promoter family protein [candidate division WOR-3 bacterium]